MANIDFPGFAIKENGYKHSCQFSVCTIVTKPKEYAVMVSSFINAGFTADICEYRYADNTNGNKYNAYEAINLFLQHAQGEYIIVCHQDVLLNFDNIDVLKERITSIDQLDSNWGILSNAGGMENDLYNRCTIGVSYADGWYQRVGTFPKKVATVDEHFILVKREANLALSANLTGFHLYGTDLCLVAELLGYTAWVIDFKLTHNSYGTPGSDYYAILDRLKQKYIRFMRSRRIVTTITDFYLSTSQTLLNLAESKWGKKISRKAAKIRSNKK